MQQHTQLSEEVRKGVESRDLRRACHHFFAQALVALEHGIPVRVMIRWMGPATLERCAWGGGCAFPSDLGNEDPIIRRTIGLAGELALILLHDPFIAAWDAHFELAYPSAFSVRDQAMVGDEFTTDDVEACLRILRDGWTAIKRNAERAPASITGEPLGMPHVFDFPDLDTFLALRRGPLLAGGEQEATP